MTSASSPLGLAAAWGILGVIAILVKAIVRLVPICADLADRELTPLHLASLAGWVALMALAEGYRGFHRQFSPRVVARAMTLSAISRPWLVALAPLFCAGLVHATRRRLITSWLVTLAIVGLVVGVRALPQPWRGIIDAGVIVGLAIGVASILYHVVVAWQGRDLRVSADLPR